MTLDQFRACKFDLWKPDAVRRSPQKGPHFHDMSARKGRGYWNSLITLFSISAQRSFGRFSWQPSLGRKWPSWPSVNHLFRISAKDNLFIFSRLWKNPRKCQYILRGTKSLPRNTFFVIGKIDPPKGDFERSKKYLHIIDSTNQIRSKQVCALFQKKYSKWKNAKEKSFMKKRIQRILDQVSSRIPRKTISF